MEVLLVVTCVALAGAVAALIGIEVTRRRYEAQLETAVAETEARFMIDDQVDSAMQRALSNLRAESAADQSAMMQATLDQMMTMQREQFGAVTTDARAATAAELGAKKDVIDARLGEVQHDVRTQLERLTQIVSNLSESNAKRFGEVDRSLRTHAEIASSLSESTQALRQAMASPSARGQWGERMAEDVLRKAGFIEHVNYEKQTQLDGASGRPDFTFLMPKGQRLYMDVKFPMSNYLRYLEAATDAEREAYRSEFSRDVRRRVKELAVRDYARESASEAVDYVLLFLPNETLTSFIHENDPHLIDDALEQRVVMCSPMTLFAFLGVIRQAHDNFMIEQTSDEILGLIGRFGQQWGKYNDELGRVQRSFEKLDTQFNNLLGTRRRQLEKPLAALDNLRRQRNVPIEGELFIDHEPEVDSLDPAVEHSAPRWSNSDETPANVRRLGA